MEIIEQSIKSDFSEAAVEQAMIEMTNHCHKNLVSLVLNVSVFDAQLSIAIMIDDHRFRDIRYVHLTPEFRQGEFSVVDEYNKIIFKGGPC